MYSSVRHAGFCYSWQKSIKACGRIVVLLESLAQNDVFANVGERVDRVESDVTSCVVDFTLQLDLVSHQYQREPNM